MALPPPRPFGHLPRPLAASAVKTLAHVAASVRPRGGIYDVDVDQDLVDTMLHFVPYMAPPIRFAFPFGLFLIDFSPLFLGKGFRRFRSLSREEALEVLGRFERGPEVMRLLFDGLKALAMVAFYQQPPVLAALEYDVAPRMHELVARRARLMQMDPALANPRNVPGADKARGPAS